MIFKATHFIEQLHVGGNGGVKSIATSDVITDLGKGGMHTLTHGLLCLIQAVLVQGLCGPVVDMSICQLPQALEKTMRTLHTGVHPFQRLLGRRGKHGEQAYRVGTVTINKPLRVNGVALRFRHLGAVLQHHALSQQTGKRFIRDQQAFIAHQLVKEARVQQVQHGVFDTTDIVVDRQPVIGTLIQHAVVLVGAGITCEIPGRFKKRIKGVGFTLGTATAFRTAGVNEVCHLLQRRTGRIHRDIRW